MNHRFSSLCCAILLCATSLVHAQTTASFNEFVDLVSTVWRLAGTHEYNLCLANDYAHEVDSVFAPYKNHPAVKLAAQYHNANIAYDAVVAYGLHLTTNNGNIVFSDKFLAGSDDSFDRWSPSQKTEFLSLLNDFYHQSQFHNWFLKQQELYARVEKGFDEINQKIDYPWFSQFFGPQHGSQFHIVLSLLVGPQNYGCSAKLTDGSNALSPVIGGCQIDHDGHVIFSANSVLPIVIHEFCHHYCNPLNSQFWHLMDKSAKNTFKICQEQLAHSPYGSAQIMMNETFVRASVIRYMQTHFPQSAEAKLVRTEAEQGFILTQTLCDALKQYEQQREKFTTMTDFMPTLAQSVNNFNVAKYQKLVKKEAKLNASYNVNIKNGARNIPCGEFTVILQFSKPMTQSIGFNPSSSGTDFPKLKDYNWPNNKTLELTFILEPAHSYGFTVIGRYFSTQDGHSAGQDTEINFSTSH